MRRIRDVFYIHANFEENYFTYYGMEFREFIKYCPIALEHLLITDGRYIAHHFNRSWFFETADGKEEVSELSENNLYDQGNFHWIDYNSETNLNDCTPEEKAEIIYLSHFWKPLNSPFFNRINNQFAYLAHDDGWYCKLYCKDMSVFKEIIANKIIAAFSANKRRKIVPMDGEIKDRLLELTEKGLLIDFSQIFSHDKSSSLDFYAIGSYTDMDEMYHNLERNKQTAELRGFVEHTNKKWKINIL